MRSFLRCEKLPEIRCLSDATKSSLVVYWFMFVGLSPIDR